MQTQANADYVHVVCAHCATENRIAAGRLNETPKCGKCGAALLPGKPVDLNDATYDTVIARTGLPVVVDYWAAWCGPCRAMAPQFEAAARELQTRVLFAKVNTEEAQAVAARAGIRAIPTLALFRDGHEIARTSGAMDARTLINWITKQV
jgi:thioredoxin 2